MNKSIIEIIQDDDPSYNPLLPALEASNASVEDWNAAISRVYYDGYYGPVSNEEWAETHSFLRPFSVPEANEFIAKVLEEVDDYWDIEYCDEDDNEYGHLTTTCTGHRVWDSKINAGDIRAALVPWYHNIYGTRYPQVGEFIR
jgi:hypothetical protein